VLLDRDRCVRAALSKDSRFDGQFVTAVVTTKIYCRPSCPVVPPKPQNMRFLPTAAAAQAAGFRACKRCRPNAAPGSPEWDTRSDVVARAVRLIADGVVDRDGVDGLATRLGYSPRQLQRQMSAVLGVGPLAVARHQRAQAARALLETTTLTISEVAFAVLTTLIGLLIAFITYPLIAAVVTVMYYDLRVRNEGFDLHLLARGVGADTSRFETSPERPESQPPPSSTGGFRPPEEPATSS